MNCFGCQKTALTLVEVVPGKHLCETCRKQLRRARKAEKRRNSAASYYEALAHPELRGLKGIRK